MKRISCCILSALLCICFLCACTEGNSFSPGNTGREVLMDSLFEKGIAISNLKSHDVATTQWKYSGNVAASESAVWSLGQYCDLSATRFRLDEHGVEQWRYDSTVNDLSLGTIFDDVDDVRGIESLLSEGKYKLTNRSGSKEIIVNTKEGAVSLNADTSKEYIDEAGNILPRKDGEDWVHMVLGQAAGGIRVAACDQIRVRITFTISEWELYDRTGGVSQFQWIFSIKDYASPIGDYFWFNMTLFDDRYTEDIFPGNGLYDGGKEDATQKYIYAPSGSYYSDKPIEIGKTYKLDIDIKPLIEEAYADAKAKGALEQTDFENLGLNSLNIGWEVSDVAKVGADISGLSLQIFN